MSGLVCEAVTDSVVPHVGITVTGLSSSGPSVVTLWRSTASGQRRIVRGWNRRQIYGTDYDRDYEVPLGRPVVYDLQVIVGAVIPDTVSATVILATATGYVQDPLLPTSAVRVSSESGAGGGPVLRASAVQELSYAVGVQLVPIVGAREPVAITGARLAAAEISFDMATRAAQDTTDLHALLSQTECILVRPLPEWGPLPDLVYTVPPAITQRPIDVSWGGSLTEWSLTGASVRPPAIQVLVALWTYDQVGALWSTYNSAQAAATASSSRYLDAAANPMMGM